MSMTPNLKIEKGDILIGQPTILGDMTFNRAVIFIVDFNEEGVVGFIINKPSDENLKDLLPEVEQEFKVFDGGPVEKDKLYFLHNRPDLIEGGLRINEEIYWGGDYKNVVNLINDRQLSKSNIKFFMGYSGWAEMQLESEIKNNVWLLQKDFDPVEVLTSSKPSFWNKKVRNIGGEFLIWSNAPDNFNYN